MGNVEYSVFGAPMNNEILSINKTNVRDIFLNHTAFLISIRINIV